MSHKSSSDRAPQIQSSLLIATRNVGKLAEFRQLLSGFPLELLSLEDFPAVGEAPETGHTFAENATMKARFYFERTGVQTLADDSGLEVEALGGEPGVRSARYAGENATAAMRNSRLLTALANTQDTHRRARFLCVLSLIEQDGKSVHLFSGSCEGHIAHSPRGDNGFGYDPLFVPEGFSQTFGELPSEVKNEISHRAQALKALKSFFRSRFDLP